MSRTLAIASMARPRNLATLRLKRNEIVGGWAFWRGIATPGYIRDQINVLYADTLALMTSCANESKANPSDAKLSGFFTGSIMPFMKAVSKFHDEHQTLSSNLWGSVLDTVNEYRERLKALHLAALASGFTLSGSPVPKGATTFGDLTVEKGLGAVAGVGLSFLEFLKTLVIVALVGAGVILGIYVFKGGSLR